jgi:hypothetical protein
MRALIATAAALLVLSGCGEPDQTQSGVRGDKAVWQGTGTKPPFADAGWQPGDRNSWEQHLKVRTQRGQNDYAKVN